MAYGKHGGVSQSTDHAAHAARASVKFRMEDGRIKSTSTVFFLTVAVESLLWSDCGGGGPPLSYISAFVEVTQPILLILCFLQIEYEILNYLRLEKS